MSFQEDCALQHVPVLPTRRSFIAAVACGAPGPPPLHVRAAPGQRPRLRRRAVHLPPRTSGSCASRSMRPGKLFSR